MTDGLTEDLDQQLHKLQSARDQLQHTRQLLSESDSVELKSADSRLAEMIEALNVQLEEAQRKKAQQQAALQAEQKLRQLEAELSQALTKLVESQSEITRLRLLSDELREAHDQSLAELEAANEHKEEAELLLDQLHVVQEVLESLYQKSQADKGASEQKIAQLNAQLKEFQAAKATVEQRASKQALQMQAELEQARAEKAAGEQTAAKQAEHFQRQLDEIQQENELLLQQLHHVQEEIEQHFLDKQQLHCECEMLRQRWARLQRSMPGYLDYELIEPIAVDAVSDQPRVDWRAVNITVAGQLHPQLAFSTLFNDGMIGIVLDGIELFPGALRGPKAAKAIAQFRCYGSRQWNMVLAAATALEQFFTADYNVAPELSFDPVFWRQALLPLVADLRALPAVFRFDHVKLKRELVNPDYEHLWLVLEGASLGQQHWPKFELRLGAADIKPGRFSRHPKLELPLIDGKTRPFDSWFEESSDDFGGKFELRFDIDRQLMDLGVWARLSTADRALLLAVMTMLHQSLQQLQADQVAISREWSEWQGLVDGMLRVVRKLSGEMMASQQKSKAKLKT